MGQARRDGRRGGSAPLALLQSRYSQSGLAPSTAASDHACSFKICLPRPPTFSLSPVHKTRRGTTKTCDPPCTTNPGNRHFHRVRDRHGSTSAERDSGREGTRRRAASVSVLPTPTHERSWVPGSICKLGSRQWRLGCNGAREPQVSTAVNQS